MIARNAEPKEYKHGGRILTIPIYEGRASSLIAVRGPPIEPHKIYSQVRFVEKIKWKEISKMTTRVVLRELHSMLFPTYYGDKPGTLTEQLTEFGKRLCRRRITRAQFDTVCEDLKSYEGHVLTASKGNYYGSVRTIKYNPEPMQAYGPNPPRSWPQRRPRHTGHKKTLAENQFHVTGDLQEYADIIFGAADAEDIAHKKAQNEHYMTNQQSSLKSIKYTYENLMANINKGVGRGKSGIGLHDYLTHDSLFGAEQYATIERDLRTIIRQEIAALLLGQTMSRALDGIIGLRVTNLPYDTSVGNNALTYSESAEIEQRLKKSLVFGYIRLTTEDQSGPTLTRNMDDDALDEWAENRISVCKFPHPEVMSDSTMKTQTKILNELVSEYNKYTEILRVIFNCYRDLAAERRVSGHEDSGVVTGEL